MDNQNPLPSNPRLKLFVVRTVQAGYVLAANEEQALELVGDPQKWEEVEVEVHRWQGEKLNGWDNTCLVYNPLDQDITLARAKRIDAHKHLEADV